MSVYVKLTKWVMAVLVLSLTWAACTRETGQDDDKPTPEGDSGERHEVLLTLNNKLALRSTATKAETKAIATLAENAISTLDVYVFGSNTETGEYTFQERFAYRADSKDPLPAGASELQLAIQGADDEKASGLLKLKKGLFVKLFCIANDTSLFDPTNGGDGVPVNAKDFVPLTLTTPGEEGAQVATPGSPKIETFTS